MEQNWQKGSKNMKSYASIDRIEEKFAVCEVEMIEIENSRPEDYCEKETKMMNILLEKITYKIGDVKEGDILVIEHNGEKVTEIYYKDEQEKQRRIAVIVDGVF